MKKFACLIALCCALCSAHAQEVAMDTAAVIPDEASMYVTKQFVIVQSTKSYATALATAKTAAQKLGAKLDLRGLKSSKTMGLTFSRKECEEYYEYPCYIARGRFDDGIYTSIEYSNQYDGFSEGYYIVIVGSGEPGDAKLNATLKKAKTIYKDAYTKRSKVYVGCMH